MMDLKVGVYIILEPGVGMINSVWGSLYDRTMEKPNKHKQDADRKRRGHSGSVYQFGLSRKKANM